MATTHITPSGFRVRIDPMHAAAWGMLITDHLHRMNLAIARALGPEKGKPRCGDTGAENENHLSANEA